MGQYRFDKKLKIPSIKAINSVDVIHYESIYTWEPESVDSGGTCILENWYRRYNSARWTEIDIHHEEQELDFLCTEELERLYQERKW